MHTISEISLIISCLSCLVIVADLLAGNKQKMPVMNIVWPVTALYGGVIALAAYYAIGRKQEETHHGSMINWKSVTKSTLHCGSGCTLGDIIAEVFVLLVPVTIAGSKVYGTWVVDFVLAFLIGIIFQYYAIKPMNSNMPPSKVIGKALKADTLSLVSWQVGMYGWMAIVLFCIYDDTLPKTGPVFWFMMQVAMIVGFCTAYPVNLWLLKKGIKEAM